MIYFSRPCSFFRVGQIDVLFNTRVVSSIRGGLELRTEALKGNWTKLLHLFYGIIEQLSPTKGIDGFPLHFTAYHEY